MAFIHFSREAKEKNATVVSGFSHVSLLVYGNDHTGLPIFRSPFMLFDTHASSRELLHLRLTAFQIGFLDSLQPSQFSVF